MDGSTSYSQAGRIPQSAAVASTIALFVLAIISAGLRTAVRWHYKQLRWLDDGFVAFSVVMMSASFGLWLAFDNDLFITEALIYAPLSSGIPFGDIFDIAIRVNTFTTAYIIISITGIFAIKFSFLFFFRSLINRLPRLELYWKVVVGYTAVVWAISCGVSAVACPFFDIQALQCAQGSYLARAFDVSVVLLVFDVSSDVLIISIPVILLRKIKIPVRSKVYLFCSLGLSLVMIVVAILQGATLETGGVAAIDVVFQICFQFYELAIAVMVVSLTAFRTFFIGHRQRSRASRSPRHSNEKKKWYSSDSAKKAWKKVSQRSTTTGTISDDDTLVSEPPRIAVTSPRTPLQAGPRQTEVSNAPPQVRDTIASEIAHPLPEPPAQPPLPPISRRPRSQNSTERRISYFQRIIRQGFERAVSFGPRNSEDSSLELDRRS